MQTDWAGENLQVIRTLMERASLYRRALAPIMLTLGALGLGDGDASIVAGDPSVASLGPGSLQTAPPAAAPLTCPTRFCSP